jgi:hypothetical protein
MENVKTPRGPIAIDIAGPVPQLPALEKVITENRVQEATSGPVSEPDESIYDRFSSRQKTGFTIILSLCGILVPIASTACLTAVPEIAIQFQSTGDVINISNGLFSGAMGISSFFWGSLGIFGGRRIVLRCGLVSFFGFSLGCALAPNLAAFFAFRILSGLSGTALIICGPGIIGDLYKPVSCDPFTSLIWSENSEC